MGLGRTLTDREVRKRKAEEAAYARALEEFQAGIIRTGLMAKAIAQSDGDEGRAKAIYLGLAAKAIEDDAYIEEREREIQAEAAARALPPPQSDETVLFFGSLIVPGVSQLVQRRYAIALAFFVFAIVMWFFLLGWIVHIAAAAEAVAWQRRSRSIAKSSELDAHLEIRDQ